jgi:hypothetical protein
MTETTVRGSARAAAGFRALGLGAILSLAASLTPTAAAAQAEPTLEQRRAAQMAYDRAQALRAGSQHADAAQLYEAADRLAPSVQALGNAIRSHRDCRTPEHEQRAATLALRLLARYGTDPRFAGYANQVITETSSSLVRISIACDGCEAEADGAIQPATEFFLTPGSHRVVAHWPGGRTREHRINNARAGTSENVTLEAPTVVRPVEVPVANPLPSGNGTTNAGTSTTGTSTTGAGATGTSTTGTSTTGTSATGTSTTGASTTTDTGAAGDRGRGALAAGGTAGDARGSTPGGEAERPPGFGSVGPVPGEGLVRPPPSRGGIPPAVFVTSLVLTAGAGGVLVWSGLDTNAGVPAYMSAAARGDLPVAQQLLTEGQGKELRTNILIGVTAGLGAVTVATAVATRWGGPRVERPVAVVPVVGPLPGLAVWGRF